MDHEHEAEHFPKVTTDETAAATDTGAFLKALKEKEGGARQADEDGPSLVTSKGAVKIILLGDSAVGKSKLVERFLMDGYQPQQLSTFALTLFRYNFKHPDGRSIAVDFWDTAGQERFNNLHPSYFYRAHACVLAFDVTRKVTYKNLDRWYKELEEYCPGIPTIVVANKIDVDYRVTERSFAFPQRRNLPFFFVSASDGTNVVKVFQQAITLGLQHKENPSDDYLTMALELLGESSLDDSEKP
mmetsp:Transcript_6185/g.15345  ORF Transcript_6185/g.15345 Transcript_6185/m.15345 type:complete len:243 (-) Transcript_6185:1196-1924(-)